MKQAAVTFLRSDPRQLSGVSLFNFEGPGKETQKRETVVKDGGLAQLGERLPCKQEVSGSIPLISTIFS